MKMAIIAPGKLPVPAKEGGAVETLIDTFVSMAKYQHNIDVYSVASNIGSERIVVDGNVTYFQTSGDQPRKSWILSIALHLFPQLEYRHYLKYLHRKFMNANYDCVIIENRPGFVPCLSRVVKSEIYLHIHNDNMSRKGAQLRYIPKYCTEVLAVSQYIKNQIDSIYNGSVKVEVLHNGIEVEKFKKITDSTERLDIRERYKIAEDDFVIVFTGRVCKEKGVRELIKAFSLLNDHRNMVLLIIGASWFGRNSEDPYTESAKELANKCTNRIIFTGYVDNSEVARIEGIADIAVFPSLWEDPLPLTIIEAMASELPVISTNSGGIPEMCDSETGFILERGEHLVEDIMEAILCLYFDENLRQKMGKAGRSRVEKYFSKEYFYSQYIAILSKNNDHT